MASKKRGRKPGPRVLTLDIENLPLEVWNWSLFQDSTSVDMVKTDCTILSVAWQWGLHSKQGPEYIEVPHSDIRNDYAILVKLRDLLDQADIVIGHNVRRFDIRKLRARKVQVGLPPFREPQVADTLEMAKAVGMFTSNKLEYLSAKLTSVPKYTQRKYSGFLLWRAVLEGDPGVWPDLKKYNKIDVRATVEVFKALRPWAPRMPNFGLFYKDDEPIRRCPRCGSPNLKATGQTAGQSRIGEYTQYKCGNCEGFSRTRTTENSTKQRKMLLSL